jgi:2-keto-4-pentenoate hydratase
MDVKQATDILWQSMQQGDHAPQALRKTLSLGEAYQVQLGILDRLLAGGQELSGWKIGGTSDAARQMLKLTEPVRGYLLAKNHYASGHTFEHAAIGKPVIESELCITIGKDLKGPGVTRQQVVEAVSAISPAFELVQMRSDMASDLPLGVADDVAQWGVVLGTAVSPYPQDLDLGGISIEMKKNGEVVQQALGREVIDDQLDALAWLANRLAEHGRTLEAGQSVMTGSCTRPAPIAQGDTWQTTFSSVGTVTATFV